LGPGLEQMFDDLGLERLDGRDGHADRAPSDRAAPDRMLRSRSGVRSCGGLAAGSLRLVLRRVRHRQLLLSPRLSPRLSPGLPPWLPPWASPCRANGLSS